MKIARKELNVIRSLANDLLRELPKNIDLDADEFVTLCWVKAISHKLNLNLQVELPTRFKSNKKE